MSTASQTAHAHHAIDYIEIAVTDLDAAKNALRPSTPRRSGGRSWTTAPTTRACRGGEGSGWSAT
jgi:hypothetical protein